MVYIRIYVFCIIRRPCIALHVDFEISLLFKKDKTFDGKRLDSIQESFWCIFEDFILDFELSIIIETIFILYVNSRIIIREMGVYLLDKKG